MCNFFGFFRTFALHSIDAYVSITGKVDTYFDTTVFRETQETDTYIDATQTVVNCTQASGRDYRCRLPLQITV